MTLDTQQNNPAVAQEETPKKEKVDLEKLKLSNDEFEKELVRARELRAEAQRIEAEKLLSGTAGNHIEIKPVDPAQKIAEEIVKAFH